MVRSSPRKLVGQARKEVRKCKNRGREKKNVPIQNDDLGLNGALLLIETNRQPRSEPRPRTRAVKGEFARVQPMRLRAGRGANVVEASLDVVVLGGVDVLWSETVVWADDGEPIPRVEAAQRHIHPLIRSGEGGAVTSSPLAPVMAFEEERRKESSLWNTDHSSSSVDGKNSRNDGVPRGSNDKHAQVLSRPSGNDHLRN